MNWSLPPLSEWSQLSGSDGTRPPQAATKRRGRRRQMSLESLESRLALTGNITIPPIAMLGGQLTITGDTNGDNIPIKVNSAAAGGTVSVGPTFINGSFQTFTTIGAVTSINICLPGGGNNTTNTVSITGPGKNLPTTLFQNTALGEDASAINIISPCNPTTGLPVPPTTSPYPLVHNLNLTITGVNASGALNVEQLARGGTANGGTLNASVRNSVFSSLEIEQTGCCPAAVTLAGDRVPGTVEVYEGYANGDSITLTATATGGPDVFGSTILQQWTPSGDDDAPAPIVAGCVGGNDTICVVPNALVSTITTANTVQDLTIVQGGTGGGQQVVVNGLHVSPTSFGVDVFQAGAAVGGNGPGPAGPAAKAVVCNVSLIPGVFPNVPPIPSVLPGVDINQTGGGNYADVANVFLPGDIEIEQNTGGGNYAEVLRSSIGLNLFSFSPYIIDIGGQIEISQDGSGGPNTAILDGDQANNADITQGNNNGPGDCFGPAAGSLVQVNDTTIVSDLTITQGYSDTADTGSNIVAIASLVRTTDPGLPTSQWRCPVGTDCFGGYAATPVYAFDTDITQRGLGNTLYLGAGTLPLGTPATAPTLNASGFAFQTTFLDAYTGSGGATVYATYVNVSGGTDDGTDELGTERPDGDNDYDGEPLSGPFAGDGINVSSSGGFNVFFLNVSAAAATNPNAVNNFSLVFDPSFSIGFLDYGF